MEKIISALLTAEMPIAFLVLLVVIGMLIYMLINKNKHIENENKESIEALKIIIQEQHNEMSKLSHVVYEFKKEITAKEEEVFRLREEILDLKAENRKLRDIVERLEKLVNDLTKENEKLRGMGQ